MVRIIEIHDEEYAFERVLEHPDQTVTITPGGGVLTYKEHPIKTSTRHQYEVPAVLLKNLVDM